MTTTVPSGATSGRISDTTPAGAGISSNYFFIPPAPLTAADVEVFSSMAIGESKNITIATANKVAMVLFDGTAGQRVSLTMSGVTIASSTVTIYKPDGSTLASTSVNTSGGFIDTRILPATGTYTILVDPASTNTGNMTLNLFNATNTTGTITSGEPGVTVTTTIPGQNAELTFSGTAGQRISIKGVAAFSSCWTVGLYAPDGSQVANTFSCGSTIFIEPQTLPVTGNYVVLVDPSGSITGQATITLYTVVDVTGSINFGGPTVPVTIDTPGQNARLTFTGTAGQRASVNGTASLNGCWSLGIFKADGTQLTNTFSCGSTIFVEPIALPEDGTYTVVVDPNTSATGSANVTLYNVTDITGSITPNGPSVPVSLPTPGQNARLTFNGTVGQRVSLNGSATLTGCWTLAILKPDGSTLASTFSCGSSIFIEPQTLAVAGTYTVLIDPNTSATGSATVTLYNVVDTTGTLTINAPAINVSLTTPGQISSLTFSGTASQQVTVRVAGSTFSCVTVTLRKPDGTNLTSTFSCGSTFNLATQTLPVAGTYTVIVDPNTASTGSLNLSVTNP